MLHAILGTPGRGTVTHEIGAKTRLKATKLGTGVKEMTD